MPFVLAQESTGAGAGSLFFLALMAVVFWFLIIRPQRKRAKDQQQLAASLRLGDEVSTIGGIKGIVVSLSDDDIVLDIEEGRVRVARRAVANRLGPDTAEEDVINE